VVELSAKPGTIVVGNWKMNLGPQAGHALAVELAGRIPARPGVEVVIAPPFVSLPAVRDGLRGSSLALAAQNMHWQTEGAFTGEVAAPMLAEVGCRYVIIGHSERRQLFAESDATVNRKVRAALQAGLLPIICVGETEAERDGGAAAAVLERQVSTALLSVPVEDLPRLLFAYEPVWAIGTGRAAGPQIAAEVATAIRDLIAAQFHADAAAVPVLYGGSVKAENAADFASRPELSGALVGGASLRADAFAAIVESFAAYA